MDLIYLVSIWLLPALIAITFHEAAHGYVARFLGDDTAFRLGRVSLNPLRHIDPFGTVLLPGLLLLARSPFLFGYAKPVPVNFRALRNPRSGMVLVAAAGPAMNICLAIVAALSFHLLVYLPATIAQWVALNLKNALVINVVLAVFNLFPLPTSRRRADCGWNPSQCFGQASCSSRALRDDRSYCAAHFPASVGFTIGFGPWFCFTPHLCLNGCRYRHHSSIDRQYLD
jgi:hypothetical protein